MLAEIFWNIINVLYALTHFLKWCNMAAQILVITGNGQYWLLINKPMVTSCGVMELDLDLIKKNALNSDTVPSLNKKSNPAQTCWV